jgi:hypothetical protein
MNKWTNELNRQFSKEAAQIPNKMAIKEMQIKTTEIPSYPVKMAIVNNTNKNKYWQ